jgi:hypothetical protein
MCKSLEVRTCLACSRINKEARRVGRIVGDEAEK